MKTAAGRAELLTGRPPSRRRLEERALRRRTATASLRGDQNGSGRALGVRHLARLELGEVADPEASPAVNATPLGRPARSPGRRGAFGREPAATTVRGAALGPRAGTVGARAAPSAAPPTRPPARQARRQTPRPPRADAAPRPAGRDGSGPVESSASSARRASPMSRRRRLRVALEAAREQPAEAGGRRGRQRAPSRARSFSTAASTSLTVSPSNSRRPVSISKSTTPKAQTSARLSTACPRACSGDMYAAVPRIRPAAVPRAARAWGTATRSAEDVTPRAVSAPSALARPKSSTLTLPSGVTLTFGRLEVAVDDALLVRRFERLGDLLSRSRSPRRPGPRRASARSARSSPATSSIARKWPVEPSGSVALSKP